MNNINELLEEINGLSPKFNPLIDELSKKYKNDIKLRKLDGGIVKEGYIYSTEDVDIFTDTNVSLELNRLKRSKLLSNTYIINPKNFPTSAFDVLLCHITIKLVSDIISFPTISSNFKIADVNDLLFFKLVNRKTFIFHKNGNFFISKRPIGDFNEVLKEHPSFLSVNKDYIINLKCFDRVEDFNALVPFNDFDLEKLKFAFQEAKNSNVTKNLVDSEMKEQSKIKNEINEGGKVPHSLDADIIKSKANKIYFKIPIKENLQKDFQDYVMNAYKR